MEHVFVFPQNSYVEILTLNGMVLRGGAFASYIRSWGWSPRDRISALIEETPELSLSLSHVKKPGRELSPVLNHADLLILNFQPLEQWEKNKCLLLKPPCLRCAFYSSPN